MINFHNPRYEKNIINGSQRHYPEYTDEITN